MIAAVIVLLALLAFCLRLSETNRAEKSGKTVHSSLGRGGAPKTATGPTDSKAQGDPGAQRPGTTSNTAALKMRRFVVANHSQKPVWVGTQTIGAFGDTTEHTQTSGTLDRGWRLGPLSASGIAVPGGWQGKIWGRTDCGFDPRGAGVCRTGGCGCCMRCLVGPAPPATVAEFVLDAADGNDYFSVSLAQGYNLPMAITPIDAKAQIGGGPSSACVLDLRADCPVAQQVQDRDGHIVGCNGACATFETDDRCCRGMYGPRQCGDPSVPRVPCRPTPSAAHYKRRCPTARSYAGDAGYIANPSRTDGGYMISFIEQPPNAPLTG